MAEGRFVAYFRTSTKVQDLGIEAQKAAVLQYLNGGAWSLVGEFEEHESGKNDDRAELKKALAACKKLKATLIIAKMDRLSRKVSFISTLMDSGVDFVAVDNPTANKLTIHILAAVAEHEREQIAKRTSEALQALKAKSVIVTKKGKVIERLGNPKIEEAQAKGREVRIAKADAFAANVLPVIDKIRAGGAKSLQAIAAELNARGVKTPRGGEWGHKQVQLVLQRG